MSDQQEEEVKTTKVPIKKRVKGPSIIDEDVYRPHGTGLDAGQYHLVGVVTHKGRSSTSGHYVGWVHKSGDTWYQYDDDIVSVKKTEDILALRGGGDWHMAYQLLYRKIEVVDKKKM